MAREGQPIDARIEADLDFRGSSCAGVARRLGIEVGEAAQMVEAAQGGVATTGLLPMEAHSPLLRLTRVTYLTVGRPLGLTRSLYRGGRFFPSSTLLRYGPLKGGRGPSQALSHLRSNGRNP